MCDSTQAKIEDINEAIKRLNIQKGKLIKEQQEKNGYGIVFSDDEDEEFSESLILRDIEVIAIGDLLLDTKEKLKEARDKISEVLNVIGVDEISDLSELGIDTDD